MVLVTSEESTLGRLARLTRAQDVIDLVSARAALRGYEIFALGAPPRGNTFNGYFHSTWPQFWIDLYTREGLVADDPMPLAAAVNPMPFLWSDLVSGRAGITLTERQRRAPRIAATYGWREGLCVPIHGPGATVALASYTGAAPDTSLAAIAELHLLTLHAHVRLSTLTRDAGGGPDGAAPVLSTRESEALACLFAGLTDAGTAQKMGVSERTARFHIDNVRRKLGARTRAQALAAAIALGLLGP